MWKALEDRRRFGYLTPHPTRGTPDPGRAPSGLAAGVSGPSGSHLDGTDGRLTPDRSGAAGRLFVTNVGSRPVISLTGPRAGRTDT